MASHGIEGATLPGDLLIKGATVLTSAQACEASAGDILIRDGIIAQVGPGLVADGVPVFHADGCLAIPGLINAHLHSPGNLMRGTLDGLPLE
ncbi:MAG: hypothetical protein AAGD34_12830, partial [Pseudomonadota bacterium]